jgi:hypothetical protein
MTLNGYRVERRTRASVFVRSNEVLGGRPPLANDLHELRLDPDGVHEATEPGVEALAQLKFQVSVSPMTDNFELSAKGGLEGGLRLFWHRTKRWDAEDPHHRAD